MCLPLKAIQRGQNPNTNYIYGQKIQYKPTEHHIVKKKSNPPLIFFPHFVGQLIECKA